MSYTERARLRIALVSPVGKHGHVVALRESVRFARHDAGKFPNATHLVLVGGAVEVGNLVSMYDAIAVAP